MGGAAHEICADAVVGQSAAGAKIKRRVSTFASVRAIPSGTIEQVDERLRSDQHGAVRPTGAMFPPLLTVWPNASLEDRRSAQHLLAQDADRDICYSHAVSPFDLNVESS
jgi:hypothetical protein